MWCGVVDVWAGGEGRLYEIFRKHIKEFLGGKFKSLHPADHFLKLAHLANEDHQSSVCFFGAGALKASGSDSGSCNVGSAFLRIPF